MNRFMEPILMLADHLGAYLDDVRVSTIPKTVSYTVLLLAQWALGAADVARCLGPGPCPDASTKARDGHVLFPGNELFGPRGQKTDQGFRDNTTARKTKGELS